MASLAEPRRVVVVTGGGTGVGRAVAHAFARCRSLEVWILGRRQGPLDAVVAEHTTWRTEQGAAGAAFADMHRASCDVSDPAAVAAVFSDNDAGGGIPLDRVETLVNNAGLNIPNRKITEFSAADWHLVMNVNAQGALNMMQAVLPAMRARRRGTIINVSSIAGLRGLPLAGAAYCASKAAMNALGTTVFAEEQRAGHRIRITNVCPGEVNTPILDKRPPELRKTAEERAVMLQPADVAAAVLMVASLPQRAHIPQLILRPTNGTNIQM